MEKSQKNKSQKGLWITLIVLPWISLFFIAFLQILVHAATSSNGDNTNNILVILVNILSVLLGIVAVVLIICLPIWIIKLVRHKNLDGPKSKTTAVVLAVLFAFWTWLYTYEKEAWKFWLNFILTIITFGVWGLISWIWAIIDTASKPESYYLHFAKHGEHYLDN